MADTAILQTNASKRRTKENEVLQRFVRINLEVSEIPPSPEYHEREETPSVQKESTPRHPEEKEDSPKTLQTDPVEEDNEANVHPKQVTQELTKRKTKKRRKRSRQEELYTDKDRAAAVNLGNKDIKQSLKLKMREDRSKNMLIPEEAEPGTFLALGEHEMRRGDLRIALDFINKVVSSMRYCSRVLSIDIR